MRTRFSILGIVLFVSLTGCPASKLPLRQFDLVIHGDARFTRHERAQVREAVEDLNDLIGPDSLLTVAWDLRPDTYAEYVNQLRLVRRPGYIPRDYAVLDADQDGNVVGYVFDTEVGIVTPNFKQFRPVVAHELGHLIGMDHTVEGVMSGQFESGHYGKADRSECVRVQICLSR